LPPNNLYENNDRILHGKYQSRKFSVSLCNKGSNSLDNPYFFLLSILKPKIINFS
jgi:hypothetical protein